jgi:death-on-curing protein
MTYLDKEDIIYINQRTIDVHGGLYLPPNNFLHEENLDYLLGIVDSELFGQQMYPSIEDKAAVYCYNIICNHIFSDGNKRTGLESSLAFLNLNGKRLNALLPKSDLTNFILAVASGEVSLEDCRKWFAENTESL